MTRAATALWVTSPGRLVHRFPGLRGLLGDGVVLVAAPPVAVLLPAFAVVVSFLAGALRLGYDDVYTESLLLTGALIALGCFSTQLGILALSAFAAGESLLGHPSWMLEPGQVSGALPFSSGLLGNLARVRLPLLITYLLLAGAVLLVPRTARGLVIALGGWRRVPPALAWPLASVVCVAVVWVGVDTWVAAAPTLIRPRFTFLGIAPTADAVQPLQDRGEVLVAVAVASTVLRQLCVGLAFIEGPVRAAVRRAEAAFAASAPIAQRPGWAARVGADLGLATLGTLVLAGVLEHAWLWGVAFTVLLTVRVLRSGTWRAPAVERWKALSERLPAAVRLAALWLLARLVSDALSNGFFVSYTGVALFVLAGVVVSFLVFPGPPAAPGLLPQRSSGQEQPT